MYLTCGFLFAATAQPPVKPPKQEPPVVRPGRATMPEPPEPPPHRDNSERALAVDPNVNIQLPCIIQGRVTVNGWQRDEIRVFIRNGTKVSFKVHEKNHKTGKPVWVLVKNFAGGPSPMSECLSGERIDIEVPMGASIAIAGREIETRIDSVRKAEVKSLKGDLSLRNVSGGIYAETFSGNVTVENSSGHIGLKTSSGNIIAAEVGPGQVGDIFKAGVTSDGDVTLQKVDHRQIEANTVSGNLVFNGKFLPGGIYKFKTSDGSMRLVIPRDTSCWVVASYGFGTFRSELPMKTVTQDESRGGKSVKALIGEGDATVNLITSSGRIVIASHGVMP